MVVSKVYLSLKYQTIRTQKLYIMKALILIITLTICTTSLSATNHNQDNKAAISKSDNFKTIALRTYFLEVTSILGDTSVKYSDFLRSTQKRFFVGEMVKIINCEGYRLELVINESGNEQIKAFKNFSDTYILAGENKEVKRLLNK